MLNKVLIAIAILMVLVIGGVTIVTFVSGRQDENVSARVAKPENPGPHIEASPAPAGEVIEKTFRGVGRVRAPLQASQGVVPPTVMIEPYFPYNSADRAFSEELASHIKDFRQATVDFFGGLTPNDPLLQNDTAIKQELLKRYNNFLVLGKIDSLYFTDFMVID
jgi:flagellar FliL protein